MSHRHTSPRQRSTITPLFGVAPASADPSAPGLRDLLESSDWTSDLLRELRDLVGGVDELERLDDAPLPPRDFDLSWLADDDRRLVEEVIHTIANRSVLFKGVLGDAIDGELWVIIGGLLERIARTDPAVLHRGSVTRTAAAITWLAFCGNGLLGRGALTTAPVLWMEFGVTNCAERGRSLYRATGLVPPRVSRYEPRSDVWLTDVSLLHSHARRRLIERRDHALAVAVSREQARLERRPIVDQGDGTARVNARAVTPRWAMRTSMASGRAVVLVTFGESEDDPEVLAISVPEARHLVTMIQDALAAPVRVRPG